MAELDTLTGKRVIGLLRTAKEQNVLLTIQLPGHSFEGLTVITEIAKFRRRWVLLIDPPKGFDRFASGLPALKAQFSFRGPDLVEYQFTSSEMDMDGKTLRVPVPDMLERLQRRTNFRMETPTGTTLRFTKGHETGALELINISVRGTLGVLAKPRKVDLKTLPLKVGDNLSELSIVLPARIDGDTPRVAVKRAVVRRTEHDPDRNIIRYALEFLHMTPADERLLVQFVYQLQRRFLRRNVTAR